ERIGNTVAVTVGRHRVAAQRVKPQGYFLHIGHAVTVGIGVSVIADTVAIEVGPFVGIKREQILRIGHTVTINVRVGLLRVVALRLFIPVADAIAVDIIIKNIGNAIAVLIGRARGFILPVVTQLHFKVIGED